MGLHYNEMIILWRLCVLSDLAHRCNKIIALAFFLIILFTFHLFAFYGSV